MSDEISITATREELEQQINSGLRRFLRTGTALRQIRDRQLYQEVGYESFSAYLEERFEMSRCQAYRLIDAEQVMRNLEGIAILPRNERQCRALVRLSREDQRMAWQAALDHVSPHLPTAAAVEAMVLFHYSCQANFESSLVEQLDLLGDVYSGELISPVADPDSSVSHWIQEPIAKSIDQISNHHHFECEIEVSRSMDCPVLVASPSIRPKPALVLGVRDIVQSRTPAEHRHDRVGYWRNRAINAENNLNRLTLENSDLRAEIQDLNCRLLSHSHSNSA